MSIDLGFIGAMKTSKAAEYATTSQMKAIKTQREYLFKNLDPAVIGAASLAADQARAKNQRALQGQIDPNLLASRDLATANMASELAKNGKQAQEVADRAVSEATTGPQTVDQKNALIDAAMKQLALGAKLPPDVQAELVQSGLEKSGMVTQGASAQGMGGTMLRTILGQAGVNLQMQRQQQAEGLLASASNLEAQRQNVLNTLFPNLSSLQTANMSRDNAAFNMSQAGMPAAGMSGTDVANIWLARVGAANSLTQQAGQVQAAGAMAQAGAFNSGAGSMGVNLNQAIDIGKKIFSSSGSTATDYSGGYGGAGGGGFSEGPPADVGAAVAAGA